MAEINKSGRPNTNTVGEIGDIYVDINTGNMYKLSFITTTTTYDGVSKEYEWERMNNQVWSNTVLRIEVVSELPSVEEPGVLYIVK